ncbi:PD-(D/E)XK endonuclease-like domain-containing protein OS=Lysinibacillus sphaericus OX=1421 GN=LS41612_04765 PE=4 SV=1 [Lysinibacillus sphaericus]
MPIQKRLFDILSERFDIIHVINYQSNYKHGFQTVERFLNIDGNNFEKVLDSPYSVNYHAKELLLAINGQFIANKLVKNEQNLEKINYLEFHTLQQLRRYTQNYDERYVSPRAIQVAESFNNSGANEPSKIIRASAWAFFSQHPPH